MAQLSTKRVLTAHEEKLASLRKQHKTLLKKITTERGKLNKFKEEMQQFLQSSSGQMSSKMAELHKTQKFMRETLEKCAKSKYFTKDERSSFHWMKEDLDDMFGDMIPPQMSEEELAEFIRQQAEERQKSGFDFFSQYTPDIPEEQQRSIREVYKRLAAKFHPDKAAGNAKLEQRFHTIMQRINTAYQYGDIADLLAIEEEYGDTVDILTSEDSPLRDLVEQETERLRQELELCTGQLERLKQERKKVERTQEGKMLKDYQKAKKQGQDPMREMIAGIDLTIESINLAANLYNRVLSGEITKAQMEIELEEQTRALEQKNAALMKELGIAPMPFDDDFDISEDDLNAFFNEAVQEFFRETDEQESRGKASRKAGSKASAKKKPGR